MKILTRAVLYTARKWKKSIMLFFIIFSVSALALSGLAVMDAQEEKSAELRGTTGTSFTVGRNLSTGGWTSDENGSYSTQEAISDEILEKIASAGGIKGYNASITSIFHLTDASGDYFEHINPIGVSMVDSQYYAIGCMDSQYSPLFLSQIFTLAEGRPVTKDDENGILISKDIAVKQGLKIGDTISAVNDPQSKDPTIELEITGIFEVVADKTDEKNNYNMASYYDYGNYIFISIPAMREAVKNYPDSADYSSADFFVSDPEQLESVIQEVQNMDSINWDHFTVTANNEVYERASGSMSNVSALITALIFIMVLISAGVIILILSMWMKSRKKEIGIFLAIGVPKKSIVTQYLLEVMLISALAFPLSYLFGMVAAGKIGILVEKAAESITVTAQHFACVTAGGVVILVISVITACIPIMRSKPKDILSQIE